MFEFCRHFCSQFLLVASLAFQPMSVLLINAILKRSEKCQNILVVFREIALRQICTVCLLRTLCKKASPEDQPALEAVKLDEIWSVWGQDQIGKI